MLEVYDLKGRLIGVQERREFYRHAREEFAKTGKITRKIKTIRLLLMNSNGKIYLQKRSKKKKENPGLFDKTVGGHVVKGLNWTVSLTVTLVRECAEELGFPAAVLTEEEFSDAVKTIDLGVIGVFKQVGHDSNFLSLRKSLDGDFLAPMDSVFYVGYYDGAICFKDGEASGVQTFSLEELEQELREHPEQFTEDLKYMVKKFGKHLVPIRR